MNAEVATIPNVAATLIDALIASNRGDRHAFTYNGKRYSFQDVAALMNRAGNLVKNLGVSRGESVLVLVPPSPAWVATVLGAMKARAIAVLAPSNDAQVARCVATVRPTAAIVHEARLSGVREALATIDRQRVAVVGGNQDGFRSFVDELRSQPSWLAAEEVSADEAAIGLWTGDQVKHVTHAELTESAGGSRAEALATPEAALLSEMVNAFRRGDAVELS